MPSHLTIADQVLSPPNLPSYLESIYKLNIIVGIPSDDEVIGIHSVIRAAQKAAEIPGMGDSVLLSRLSEHLFNVQMARYQSKYLGTMFPEGMTYTPPTIPVHVSAPLEPITGAPSEEELIKVQDAVRSYQQYASAPLMFDARVHMELSQHLFDIQMGNYSQRVRKHQRATAVAEEESMGTNNPGTGADTHHSTHSAQGGCNEALSDALDRSNRLAERANQLIERSNQLAERSNQITERANQLVEQSNQPVAQSNAQAERFNELFGRFNQHLEESNSIAKESAKPVEKLGEVLRNINRVLMRIQHAIVRNHKGNTTWALNCLANEKGEVPSDISEGLYSRFGDFVETSITSLRVMIDGASQKTYAPDWWLGLVLRLYGIGDEYFNDPETATLDPELAGKARSVLGKYLSSCVG